MIEDLNKYWQSSYKDFVPEAHNLKHTYKDRWVRFHALPDSKRYPESTEEYAEILRRYRKLLIETCGADETLYVVIPEYSESKLPGKPEAEAAKLFKDTQYWISAPQHEEGDEDEFYWHLHADISSISNPSLEELFRLVADEVIGNVLLIDINNNVVMHPYDGGIDVIMANSMLRDDMKSKYKKWLSTHPEGY